MSTYTNVLELLKIVKLLREELTAITQWLRIADDSSDDDSPDESLTDLEDGLDEPTFADYGPDSLKRKH